MSPAVRGAVIGGGLAGIAALVWGAAAHFGGSEFAPAAIVVGALAGFGMSQGTAWKGTIQTGALAAVVAVMGMIAGKYCVTQVMAQQLSTQTVEVTDDDALRVLVEQTYQRYKERGKDMKMPNGTYNVEIWSVARRQWSMMDEGQKAFLVEELRSKAEDRARQTASIGLGAVVSRLSKVDVLILLVGAGAAFGLGMWDKAKWAARKKSEEPDIVAPSGASTAGYSPLRGLPTDATAPAAAKPAAPPQERKVA